MRSSAPDETQVIRLINLIDEGENLDPADLEAFYGWIQASYRALEFDPVNQEQFAEYCGWSCDSVLERLYVGALDQNF
ncbi:MAG TPA: hypothetical protein VMC85_17745 [Desulfomonilaceae bacterium]|nr:hypothetical protein [Desulfomonilaceae bacterium]